MITEAASLSDRDQLVLLSFEDDTEDAPWMIDTDYHSMAIDALKHPIRRHARATGRRWYVASSLAILFPDPGGAIRQVAPDIMVAVTDGHPRNSYDLRTEETFPEFVLEVVSTESRRRDTTTKVELYRVLGASEYVLFDPRGKRRPPLTGYRRSPDGEWKAWTVGSRGELVSEVLGLTLIPDGLLLRLEDSAGNRLLTADELEEALERAERQAGQAREQLAAQQIEIERLRRGQP